MKIQEPLLDLSRKQIENINHLAGRNPPRVKRLICVSLIGVYVHSPSRWGRGLEIAIPG